MSQGAQSLHISGAKVTQDVQMDANASSALQHLKEQLIAYQTDNKKLSDQLNCLVSLIKRSWAGDTNATTHLSNIVGMEPPYSPNTGQTQEGSMARPNSQIIKSSPTYMTKCEKNWERLALKLLERDYQEVEAEIREYQHRYIENRQAYMDAVLQDHHQNMARMPLHKRSDPVPLEEFDSRFIKHNQAMQRMGTSLRGGGRRVQSAGVRRRVLVQDRVERMDVSLRELVGETPSSSHFTVAQSQGEAYTNKHPVSILRRPQSSHPSLMAQPQSRAQVNAYNDASRYLQNNLYALGENDGIKRSRPVSASSLREGDIARSRPKSGRSQAGPLGNESITSPAFITQKNERSLKYETTRPVSSKPKLAKQARRNSTGVPGKKPPRHDGGGRVVYQPQTDVFSASVKRIDASASEDNSKVNASPDENHAESSPQEKNGTATHNTGVTHHSSQEPPSLADDDSDLLDLEDPPKAPVTVRVKSAFTRRPAFIDDFAKDEQAMRDMEADFKKTALSLQKRLGIGGNGFISF